ncbi:HGSNAT [Mytilus edulis]|uniref:HGSNAT n=1 Tax=Mytilus edulis TaxID=6550 RepID=A0A8S3PZV4_MYTED|nr:HGSNAT [Mytilus edulis]
MFLVIALFDGGVQSLSFGNKYQDDSSIPMDKAKVTITSTNAINISSQSDECYKVTISHDGSLKHSHGGLISSVSLTSSTEIHQSSKHGATQNLQGVRGSPDAKAKKERLKSLDTFRGYGQIQTYSILIDPISVWYLGPGGLENYGKQYNCTGGAAGYIDRKVFGEKHIYGSPTCKCLLAGILCKFSKNDGWIPINKNLWSLSFVFCLGGFAFLLLCFCYLMIDEWKIWNGAPFYYPGMNAILVYMGHELLHKNFPVSWDVPETHASKLAIDLYGASLWVIVATYLYYKKSFYVI